MVTQSRMVVPLRPADRVEITCLVDNYADRLEADTEIAKRHPYSRDGEMLPGPVAEHGFSALIKVFGDGEEHTVLFDTGVSETAAVHNMRALEVDTDRIEQIVISHGHVDHTGGLLAVLKEIKKKPIAVVLHPDGLRKRWVLFPNGQRARLSTIDEETLANHGAQVVKTVSPYLMGNDLILATGEIRRQTDFEKGFPLSYAESDGKLEPDFETRDDQAVVVHIKGKGLVIVSGCGHAGIVNTVLYSKEITGEGNVLGVMGGFHLTGKLFEPFIDRTVGMIKDLKPRHIVPCHCTGWRAIQTFARDMSEEYIHNVVGTTYAFEK
ncbi:MAG: MBL fold metallo-hydrolase [Deltaproteobacteria bacterium]|nr:MBL fold metallo-hydrolase [Deltaproteobacteria bacterium]